MLLLFSRRSRLSAQELIHFAGWNGTRAMFDQCYGTLSSEGFTLSCSIAADTMIVAGHIKSALGKSISSVLYKDGWHGAEEQPPCHPSRDWGDKRSTRWPPLELLLNSSRLDHFMLSAEVRSSMLTQERNRQVNRIGNDWCRRF
jgi:hypothetical protein